MPTQPAETGPWAGRKVVVALGGGIACYKVCTAVSRLAQGGAEVRVLMTDGATRFVAPLTLQTLSGRPVLTSMWEADDHHDSQHIGVARWCDVMIIAPATANLIARLAAGLCDDVVSLVASALPRTTPLLLAPAMNAQMWENAITQRNLATLCDVMKWQTIGPGTGWQACRTQGAGRMSEPEAIVEAAAALLPPR